MASFTTFSEESLKRYLVMFGKGDLNSWSPITGGIENSNYFVTLNQESGIAEYVLTIIEGLDFDDVPFFNKLLTRLYHHGLPVAAPETTLDGMSSTIFCGKPTFLFRRLAGSHPDRITSDACLQIGQFLARIHELLIDTEPRRENPYSTSWMRQTIAALDKRLTAADRSKLESLTDLYENLQASELPRGLIHGDLFRDNALFAESGELTGVIDFYHACYDLLIQDLAIVLNDWCLNEAGRPDPLLHDALLAGYQSVRPLSQQESEALLPMQRTSAARFALTRYLSGTTPLKNPGQMLELARSLGQL